MLTTHQLHIDGRHHTLLPATTLEALRGDLLLVQADGQSRRTALALALTGRMKPSTGTVAMGHEGSMATLRRRSAIIDAPEVNAPEHHLTVRSLASEDLALVPLKFRDRTRPTEWLVRHGFRDILDKWVEEVDSGRLLHLQLELALADSCVDLVVIDSPDRHTANTDAWLPLLTRLATGELGRGADASSETPLRPLIVVAVVGSIPSDWNGPTAVAGEDIAGGVADGEADGDGSEDADDQAGQDTGGVGLESSSWPSDPGPQAASGLPDTVSEETVSLPTTGMGDDVEPTAGSGVVLERTSDPEESK